MKNIKTKIIVLVSLISSLGFFGTSFAAVTELYVSPASTVKNVGNDFNISVIVTTEGEKVYAVEGTIVLNNLSCKNITLSDGLVAQSVPTCSNPYFLIGIPQGTNTDLTLFKILVDGKSAGNAIITFNNVDIIDAGKSLSNAFLGGEYKINAPKPLTPATTSIPVLVAPTSTAASSSETVSTSSEAASVTTTTPNNKGNGFVATVLESLSNLRSSTKFIVSALIALIVLAIGPALLRKIEEGI